MSRSQRIGFLVVPFTALLIASTAYAQQANRGFSVIRESIDESRLATLYRNTRPEATAANDRGQVADDYVLDHLQLQLKRSPEREAAMKQYIDELHRPSSPNYHRWLTGAEFGRRFGLAPEDINAVTGWLGSHGFTVQGVQPSGLMIDFTGTAGMVRQAYHTEIHNLEVNGVMHIANMSDPKIPTALEPAVAGIVSLHDFRPKSMAVPRVTSPITMPGDTKPSGQHGLAAQDLATIYNLAPLFAAGISGKGESIVVIEDTDVYDPGDWTVFRKTFGLARAYPSGSFTELHPAGAAACTPPGVNGNDNEAILDAEWASAAAPNAAIVLASCANTKTTFGGLLALVNILNGPAVTLPSVISISYGAPEAENGAAANLAYNDVYALAVSEGVSMFVSSGDEGAASADPNSQSATHGIAVSGFTSTPFNVSVGGTEFGYTADLVNPATYWNSKNNNVYGSALSYIQEIPWNDSCASGLLAAYYHHFVPTDPLDPQTFCNSADGEQFLDTISASGGPSGCATGVAPSSGVVGGTCVGYTKPAWQSGLFGNPNDGVRDVPDLALFAANGFWDSYYVICYSDQGKNRGGSPCTGDPSTWAGVGGTSVSTPIMAGIQVLVNQRTGSRWGNPNINYYRLAALEYSSPAGAAACNSTTVNKASSTCIFYDITQGDIDLNCTALSGTLHNCYLPSGTNGILSVSNSIQIPAFGTTAGWDFSTGIGTVNAYNLVMAVWQ